MNAVQIFANPSRRLVLSWCLLFLFSNEGGVEVPVYAAEAMPAHTSDGVLELWLLLLVA